MENQKSKIAVGKIVVLTYVICMIARTLEYFCLRTDQTVIAENVFHKLFGIVVLAVSMRVCSYSIKDIGADIRKVKWILYGLLVGVGVYACSYGLEFLLYLIKGTQPSFTMYVEAFSITKGSAATTEFGFIALCILMNIINVVMEEGMFRGFYDKLLSRSCGFMKRALIVAALFGFWHITMTIRSFCDGDMILAQMLFMNFGYIFLAGMMSFKWCMLKEMTGTIWMGMGDHFFSNTITNLLHIETSDGADPLQIIRVMCANILSFTIITIVYIKWKKKKRVSLAA